LSHGKTSWESNTGGIMVEVPLRAKEARAGRRGTMGAVEEIVVDCPACGAPFALEVDEEAEEQSHFVSCPECGRALEVFVRCGNGAVQSISTSID
jgi:endogenous inhibitor of DNA gyrase (YacG/DUF329 family)